MSAIEPQHREAQALPLWARVGAALGLLHPDGHRRLWQIDALRGVAIVGMVLYHFLFDLVFLGFWQTNVFGAPWRWGSHVIAGLFVSLAGVSLWLSYRRSGRFGLRQVRRGFTLLGWGMMVSLAAFALTGQPAIIFGVLHLIGSASILAGPFLARPGLLSCIAALSLACGALLEANPMRLLPYLRPPQPAYALLVVVGLLPPWVTQLDYFPLLPWFGVFSCGVLIGRALLPAGESLPAGHSGPPERLRWLAWLGRHSLLIYLAHQPVLLVLLWGVRLLAG